MIKDLISLSLVAGLAMPAAKAHHSIAIYDQQNTVTVTGEVVEWFRGRPHSFFLIDGADSSGNEGTFHLGFGGTSRLVNENNWDESTYQVGDKVTATGYPSRVDGNELLVENLETHLGTFAMTESYFAEQEFLGEAPDWVPYPQVHIAAQITRTDWNPDSVRVIAESVGEGEAGKAYEIVMLSERQLKTGMAITEAELAPGNSVMVDGYLEQQDERMLLWPRRIVFENRGTVKLDVPMTTMLADDLGVEYRFTPPGGGMGAGMGGGMGPGAGMGPGGGPAGPAGGESSADESAQ